MASNKQASSIQDWLESLDLGHFTDRFLQNGLTELHHVCHITEDELSVLGVTQRGYQKRILNHLPTEAEAFLSEYVSGSEKPNEGTKTAAKEAPPPMPPRRTPIKQYSKENGHPTEKKPAFDDETYLLHGPSSHVDPTVNIPVLPPRRPLSDVDHRKEMQPPSQSQNFPASLGNSDPIPVLPSRMSDGHGKKARPTPQPRARSDPALPSKPPPLPDRNERPVPKLRPTPEVPPRVGPSQASSAVPEPEHSFVVRNTYAEDPCLHVPPPEPQKPNFLAPPPLLPNAVACSPEHVPTTDDFLNFPPPPPPKRFPSSVGPPPPPPKSFPISTGPPPLVKRSLPAVPNHNHRSPPDPPVSHSAPSQQTCHTDTLNPSASALQMPGDSPLPPPKASLLSPPPVLPFHPPTPLDGSEEVDMPAFPPPLPPLTSSSVPSIPARPSTIPEPSDSGLSPPLLPHEETGAHLQASLPGSTEEDTLDVPGVPPPPPPAMLSMPVIPPRPSSSTILDSIPSNLPPPPSPPQEAQVHLDSKSLTTNPLSIFDTAKENFDPFQFDPFTNSDETVDTYSADPILRPPSIFCNPDDIGGYPAPPPTSSLPPPPLPQSQSERQVPVPPSRPAPDLSQVLLSRPVPLPPVAKPEEHMTTSEPAVLSSVTPILQDHHHNPSENLSEVPSEFDERVDEYLLSQSKPPSKAVSSEDAEGAQSVVKTSHVGLREPPTLPARIPAELGQKVSPVPDIPTRPGNIVVEPPPPALLPRKTSNLIDLMSHESNVIKFRTVTDENERQSLLDLDLFVEPTQSTPSPPLPVLDEHDIESQYSKVHRLPTATPQLTDEVPEGKQDLPQIPARPPPLPRRLDPQGEAAPSSALPERPTPIGSTAPDDEYSLVVNKESSRASWSTVSEGSDRHSYILLSESVSGSHDITDDKIWPDEHPSLPSLPLSSSTLNTSSERGSTSLEDASSASQLHKPVRRAPPPPVAKPSEASSARIPQIPERPVPSAREFVPRMPTIPKEDDYHLLDPTGIGYTSPLRDEPLDSPDRIAFKELAQSEESGDDDDSGFDMGSLDYDKAAPKQDLGLNLSVDVADRRSKIDLGHVLRIGQAWRPDVGHRPLARTHSRAVDENTRKRLSKKLSQSLQDRNSTAEVPVKVTVLKKKGYLWKQGGKQNNKGFRKRWMEFDGTEMRYYENEKTLSECKGIIPVGTMRDVKNLCGVSRPFGDTKQNRITLETTGRSFHFAAETLDEGTLWANVLMQAIISYKPPPGGFPVGGDMSCPDKKGYVKIEGYHQKRFLAIKGETLFMYNTEMDFESAVAILDIQMKLASVKEMAKNKIQLATPAKIYMLSTENPQDVKEWIDAMKEAIQEGLSDHSVLEQVQQNSSNKYCADCRMRDPDWASINLGICICKNCSGLHRNLGVHLSKVRSLKMDTKVWTPALIQLMLQLGNDKSNAFWEANLNENEKAVPDDTLDRRQVYILNKYKEKKYCQSRLSTDKNMDKSLVKAASLGNLDECMQLVFSGGNVSYTREDGKSAFDVAKASKFHVVAEFLNQNVGLHVSPPRNNAVSRLSSSKPPTARESKQEFIRQAGYLYKTGNNKKEFLKRYCTLEHGIFSYFEDKNQPAKNTIEGIDMVLVAVAEPRQGHKYCFEIYTSVGRTYLLSAELEEDRKAWMVALAKIHSLECMWESLEDFEQAGFLHKKEGAAATNWQRLWFILKGKSLLSFSSVNDELDEIDLRKLISLSRQEADGIGGTDYNHTLTIVLPGKNIYLRAETKQAADCWYEAIDKTASQVGQSLEEQLLTAENVPIIVSQCINFVATHEGIMTEGIYRLSGTSSVIRKIVSSFMDEPRTARLKEEYSVHDVTGALKKFFRELPDPLLTAKLYKKWTEVAAYQDHSIRLQWYQHLLGELPPVNYNTLKMLIGHLKNVADNSDFNKMYVRNLAAVFGPTLMASSDSTFVHAEHEIAVIADLLTYYAWLYHVSEEEMAKEREKELKYQEGLSKIRAAQASDNSAEQLILMEIFMGKREQGNSINIKISMEHTAAEIIKMALEQEKEIDDGSWALFEIICKGELERLIHGYERVLPQVLSWTAQMAPVNYICIKHNAIMERIEPFMEQATLTDIVRYSESKKTFKKYTFELMNNIITCAKEKNATSVSSWKVADMKIYVGVEKKRCPPTQWGISFTINNEEGMKAMCLEKEASFLFWLAGLLKSKVVDPESLTYSSHALSFRSEHESSFARYSRNLPKELSNITSKMSFWRKSRLNSVDES